MGLIFLVPRLNSKICTPTLEERSKVDSVLPCVKYEHHDHNLRPSNNAENVMINHGVIWDSVVRHTWWLILPSTCIIYIYIPVYRMFDKFELGQPFTALPPCSSSYWPASPA